MTKTDKKIRNSLDSTITISNCGSKFETDYDYVSENGKTELKPIGKTNVYEKIQSFKDDNNIYKILNRVLQGDYSQLDTNQGIFVDSSVFPKSINEYNDYIHKCKDQFKSLEPTLKERFNNSYEYFIHTLETGEMQGIYNKYLYDIKGIENINNNNVSHTIEHVEEVVNETK